MSVCPIVALTDRYQYWCGCEVISSRDTRLFVIHSYHVTYTTPTLTHRRSLQPNQHAMTNSCSHGSLPSWCDSAVISARDTRLFVIHISGFLLSNRLWHGSYPGGSDTEPGCQTSPSFPCLSHIVKPTYSTIILNVSMSNSRSHGPLPVLVRL